MLTLNVRFWDLLTDMNNRPMKEYGKTSAEHFRMRSFGAGFAQYSASRICTLFHSHSFLKIQPIALRFSLLCRTPVFGILAQKLCDIYSSKRLVAIRQSFNGIVHFWDADWIPSHTTFFTESSVGNTLRFLIAWRITLFSDSMAFVV